MTLTFDLLTLKVVSESRVTLATSVPILVFLGLCVLDLGLMYVADVRQTDVRQHHRLMPPPVRGRGITKVVFICRQLLQYVKGRNSKRKIHENGCTYRGTSFNLVPGVSVKSHSHVVFGRNPRQYINLNNSIELF